MRTQKWSKLATLVATFGLVFCSFQASPEDIDIFSVDENADINNPNVLFVVENSQNWTRQAQGWTDLTPSGQREDQGQSEMAAIKTVVGELGSNINVGLMEYVTGGAAGTQQDYGYVRYHIRPMTDTNKASFGTILDRVYNNINDPPEARSSGNPYGPLFHDVYNYLAGVKQGNPGGAGNGTPANPAGVTADTGAYQSNFDTFRSPLTTLDTCTRTIVIFISNSQATTLKADSDYNVNALHALAGGGADGDAAIAQINFADYVTSSEVAISKAGYTDACFATATACSTAVNADPACSEEGFINCSCDGNDAFSCPTDHYAVVGTDKKAVTVVSAPETTPDAPTNLIGATCKQEGQIPATATCPSASTTVTADTPTTGTTRRTETTWQDCKYVATNQTNPACTGTKFNYEIRGTRTDVHYDTTTETFVTDLGETAGCYAGTSTCNVNDGPWSCSGFTEGCTCTVPASDSGCAISGTQRFQILGQFNKTEATQGTTFSAPPTGPYMLDEWTRFLRQKGVPIPGLSTRAQVTTYTIDVFKDQQNAVQSALLFNAARVGGGAYFQAKNRDALINALRQILTEVQAVNSAFSSASLPVNATNRAQNENQVFIGVFKPDRTKDPRWFGNMKRYQLISTGSTIDLGDSLGKPAINNQTGFLTDCAVSFWSKDSGKFWDSTITDDPDALGICATNTTSDHSDSPDGPFVEKGAAAQVVRFGNVTAAATDGFYPLNRNIYTVSGGLLADLTAATFEDGDPGTDDTAEERLVRYIRGMDVQDEDFDATTAMDPNDPGLIEPRATIHGDVVHSRPQPINYGGSTGVVVYYGSNDGHYRAVRAEDGQELWSFVAPESFEKFVRLFTNKPVIRYFGDSLLNTAPKDYFFDGSTGVYQTFNTDGTSKDTWIFPTLRRGGRRLYGLDVSTPEKPLFMWSAGCDGSGCLDGTGDPASEAAFKTFGHTWGIPNVALIKGYCGSSPCDPSAPVHAPVIVLAGGYDPCDDFNTFDPPCGAPTGSGVYVLDAQSGALVRHFDFTALSGSTGRSAPADVALIDVDNDTLVDYAYAVDTGGNVYRMDFLKDLSSKVAFALPSDWLYSRVAYTNGSGRKFLFPPALVQVAANQVYLAVGSGDREHPLRSHYPYDDKNGDKVSDGGVQNRFYVFRDVLTEIDGTTALNLDGTAPTMVDQTKDSSCGADPLLPGETDQKGWFIDLGAAGQGEQVVTSAVVAAGFVFFSTNRPTETSTVACTTSLGEARGYFLNLLNGSGAIGVTGACGGTRSSTFVGGGLPPSPVLATVPVGPDCASGGPNCELKTVVIGAVQKTGEPSSPIQSQRVRPPIPSIRTPIYWYKSTGDK